MASLKVPASVPPPHEDAEQLHKAFEGMLHNATQSDRSILKLTGKISSKIWTRNFLATSRGLCCCGHWILLSVMHIWLMKRRKG
uniref:Uncharacterized protein n=1 Tax=Salix viminalis TaxID=40686 RepID=A0A6N2NCS0_SALVM